MGEAYLTEDHIVAGLDLGASKVAVVIVAIDSQGFFRILGVGTGSHSGMRRGTITNEESLAQAIMEAVIKAERMAGMPMPPPVVGVPGIFSSSFAAVGSVDITRPGYRVQTGDMERAVGAARAKAVPPGRRVVYQSVRALKLDGNHIDGQLDGAVARRLEVDVQFMTVALSALDNYLSCLNKAGIKVKELIVQGLAAACMMLAPSHRKLGVVLVDSGAGLTDIALFRGSRLQYMSCLPVGAENFARDLTVCLGVSSEEAERLVQWVGCNPWSAKSAAWAELVSDAVMLEDYNQIFMARAEEIWLLVKEEIVKVGADFSWPAGVKLVGGGALIPGFADLGAQILDMPVEVAVPVDVLGLPDSFRSPGSAVMLGLVQWQADELVASVDNSGKPGALNVLWQRVRDWLRF